ncbi:hypothetical protein [Luteirhabdus pelagi]|uniref:hypothetical protein n=1 Tax=Luteirhabdus pelagi TaxID=2792783 RepID=UPI0019393E72|nr:hypothetical protein [Luteirhabdus pelagi]
MDKVLFGDNQFFGVNHMSEEKAIKQAQRFRTPEDIFNTLRIVNEMGIKSFVFTTHSQLEPVMDMIRKDTAFDDFKLYPCMPYAHKYANALAEMGPFDAIKKFTPGNALVSGVKGLGSLISANPVPVMQLLVDSEMKLLKDMNVKGIFLLNIITDLLLGLGMYDILKEYSDYVESKYGVKAGFFTMNYTLLHEVLVHKLGIENPIIVSNINKIGFRMNPSQQKVEEVLKRKDSTNIAMSILASGAVPPKEAVEYIGKQKGVQSVLFGASTPQHIEETSNMIREIL